VTGRRSGDAARRWAQLLTGLFGFGVAVPLMIQSGLGLGPWDAFHFGIHNLTGMSVGAATIGVGVLIVGWSTLLGIRPGPGTVVNMILVGIFIDLVLPFVPAAPDALWGTGYYLVGIALAGMGTGMYMGAGLGNGPRDGLMMGLSHRSRWPVRRVRTLIELCALAGGWLMGGVIGVGTILFTFSIGPAVQVGLRLFGALPAAPEAPPREAGTPAG
jgi:uncharacterized protein